MIKKLTKHGNSRAIVIDKGLLEAAGIDENSLFQITVNPSGGLLIQSVDDNREERLDEIFEHLNKKYSKLMRRLADL